MTQTVRQTDPSSTHAHRPPLVARSLVRLPEDAALQGAIADAREALTAAQSERGNWLFELEADCTIPAEYIMMMHYLDEIDGALEAKLAVYLRSQQSREGGWGLYHGGGFNMSCSVKSYYALKLAGDATDAPHMRAARDAILRHGGAARANVFTRIALALFGQVPWRAVPFLPVEIMLLPRWFPFHLDKIAYWSRAVMVPLFILYTRKPRARNPRNVDVLELFTVPPEAERDYFRDTHDKGGWVGKVCLLAEKIFRNLEFLIPAGHRDRATRAAEQWMLERLNGEDGLGAIFPAMFNALAAMDVLGYPKDDIRRATAKKALEKLLVVGPSSAYCQPCVSPVWDTALATLALQAVGCPASTAASSKALDWLAGKQLKDEPGDWRNNRPGLVGGGWAFQFANSHYPDLDDTAVAAWAMHQSPEAARYAENIGRALTWLVGMQSRDGGFAAYDADNTYYYLNKIPFSDHEALLDPPTCDVTARVLTVLSRVDRPEDRPAIERAVRYLRVNQESDGSWFGRWGTNYIYGTWSVLTAFAHAKVPKQDAAVRRAVAWLAGVQNADGGWGESNDTYAAAGRTPRVPFRSTPFQTAWAVLGLVAAGEQGSDAARRGIQFLMRSRQPDGLWSDPGFTAPGFPRVFYLKYHGYCRYFPLWALAAYGASIRRGPVH